ncbi:MAG TPA: hypothetical protein VE377_03085 [Candidatus Dormibacteraeota bacterium]|nr:hypothetical protein [Candidatus Dormibacteraeota bacterium]
MDHTEIRVAGVTCKVPSIQVGRTAVIVTGKWLKLAAIHDEEWLEGDVLPNPNLCIAGVRAARDLGADIFTFSQKTNDATPRFAFHHEWDSIAAIPIVSYADWWTNRVSTHLRQDVKRAAKRGVIVRSVPFTDDLVRQILDIYNETPIRQGRAFWHYGKGFDAIKMENATYVERSEFLGAYVGDELIGFMKIVYVDRVARVMQILPKEAHYDKRAMNALIAKAVELCEAKGCSHLVYGNYRYSQGADSLTAFKRKNGFEEVLVPRYYVPLTRKGALCLNLHLQRGLRQLVPASILKSFKRVRAAIYRHLKAA